MIRFYTAWRLMAYTPSSSRYRTAFKVPTTAAFLRQGFADFYFLVILPPLSWLQLHIDFFNDY